jgi:hypothetical protein
MFYIQILNRLLDKESNLLTPDFNPELEQKT